MTLIAIASGKGGTGKTTVAVNLASILNAQVELFDCDVEAPNDHLFLDTQYTKTTPVNLLVPAVNRTACINCGACSAICAFGAIAVLPNGPLVAAELCHGCGGCSAVCPTQAITEVPTSIGNISKGHAGALRIVKGELSIGQTLSPLVIEAVKQNRTKSAITILDAPAGTACPFVATIRNCDYVILVTEPTPFGFHDLKIAVETLQVLKLRGGIVINRSDSHDSQIESYANDSKLPILGRIPNDRSIAEAYSRGELIVDAIPSLRSCFEGIITTLYYELKQPCPRFHE